MLEFAWPWILCALPLPWILRTLLPAAQERQAALRISFLAELEHISRHNKQRRSSFRYLWRKHLPFILVWTLLVLAAARPQLLGEWLPRNTTGRDLLLAIDISGSMDTPDLLWQGESITRLEWVKQLFGDFIESRLGDRIGLILFGSQAYVQAPLTFDHTTLRRWLSEVQVGLAGQNTAIGEAIGLTVKRLREVSEHQRLVILISDGANNAGQVDPIRAARFAAAEQIRIYCINILPPAAPNDESYLDEALLQNIATLTGGQYFSVQSTEDLQDVNALLNQLEPVLKQSLNQRAIQPLYHWPLAIAFLTSMLLAAQYLWLRRIKTSSKI